jgi:hypothetical protein
MNNSLSIGIKIDLSWWVSAVIPTVSQDRIDESSNLRITEDWVQRITE